MSRMQYQVIMTIKESNKGSVYLASVEGYDFPLIVKRLKHGNRAVFEAIKEMKNEHIPEIYEIEETKNGLLVAEEYIEGELLSEFLNGKSPDEKECIRIAKQLCEGLKAMHEHKPPLIHRDIKPSNIIINSKGILKIIDFDSSRQYKEESESDTRLLGTEKYAAPEQYGFSQTDCRSDIYSLGVVFGSFPKGESEKKNRRWKKLVEKCTLFAPESRFQSMDEVEKALRKIEKAEFSGWIKAGGTAGGVLLLGGMLFVLSGGRGTSKEKEGAAVTPSPVTTGSENPTRTEPGPTSEAGFSSELSPTPESGFSSELSPTPESDVTPGPTIAPELTTTPEPTTMPAPTSAPKPGPTPIPEFVYEQSDMPEEVLSEEYKTIPPEWRDAETDSQAVVELKKRIREEQLHVEYCFKDRLGEKDYLLHEQMLTQPNRTYVAMSLLSYQTAKRVTIGEHLVKAEGGIIQIAGEFMRSLPNGYYTISLFISDSDVTGISQNNIILYVADSDMLEEPQMWLQNTTMWAQGEEEETVFAAVKNDSDKKISALIEEGKGAVSKDLYRILYDGRVVELSNELLQMCGDYTVFYVMSTDGGREMISVTKEY
ncbi:MAG: serine/threonine protein kinase [Lachnospiraceae bacterium]|nr:serine/threonine protein kinase [Lachnospiraceae bacterium]